MELNEANLAPEEEAGIVETVLTPETELELPKAEEEPQAVGQLFDAIKYRSVEDIPRFIEGMGINDSAMVLLSASAYAHKKGILTLLESEVLSKAIRIFTAPRPMQTPPEQKIEQPKQ
jgi:hypothetical protein